MNKVKITNSNNNNVELIIKGTRLLITDNDIQHLYNTLGQYLLRKEALK